MKKAEYVKTLEVLDIDNALSTTRVKDGENEPVHYWNGCAIWHDKDAIISGKIPFELAKKIREMDPDNLKRIFFEASGIKQADPKKVAIDDKYLKEVSIVIEDMKAELATAENGCVYCAREEEYKERLQDLKEEVVEREDTDKYVRRCVIDSVEGLIIVLNEISKYFTKMPAIMDEDIKDVSNIIISANTRDIISSTNLSISGFDWIRSSVPYGVFYMSKRAQESHFSRLSALRSKIDSFDAAVNPFIQKDLDFKDPKEYVDKIDISISTGVFPPRNRSRRGRSNCCNMWISERRTNSQTFYSRTSEGFEFRLNKELEDGKSVEVVHSYDDSFGRPEEIHELFSIKQYNELLSLVSECTVDITDHTYVTKKRQLNNGFNIWERRLEDKHIPAIISAIETAIKYANSITLDNMVSNEELEKGDALIYKPVAVKKEKEQE